MFKTILNRQNLLLNKTSSGLS